MGNAPATRRYRAADGPAILAEGFRPFFLLAGLWAALALLLWILVLAGAIALPTAFDPVAWHVHEMIFGFVAASIAGFLLTAIPNWTGRLPLHGAPLGLLAGLWIAGRLAVAVSAAIGVWTAAAIDLAFLVALAAVCLREIVAGRNWRNVPLTAAAALLVVCNALFHIDAVGLAATRDLAIRASIAVVAMLIALVGGRVVPSFTRNALAKAGRKHLPASFGAYDRATLVVLGAALLIWTVIGEDIAAGLAVALGALMTLGRLARWQGWATLGEPLLWVLHLGYLWLAAGLGLLSLSLLTGGPAMGPALHALTAGTMGTMTLAVMTRATLGHTGRALHAGPASATLYLLVSAAAVLRILAGVSDMNPRALLDTSAACWIGGFALYLVVYGPMLAIRRADGKTG